MQDKTTCRIKGVVFYLTGFLSDIKRSVG